MVRFMEDMQEFLRLPFDPSGYGDFAASYIGSGAKVQFAYKSDGVEHIAELNFSFCLSLEVNGDLNSQKNIPYDTVLFRKETNPRVDGLHRYTFMLSGSDFQFTIVAKNCSIVESISSGIIIDT